MIGIWLGASYVLGRDVPVREPYPHICGNNVQGRMSTRRVVVWIRDCAACVHEGRDQQQTVDWPTPVAEAHKAVERRTLGEHD